MTGSAATTPRATPAVAARGPFHVAELWRYPVKSLGGEQVDEVEVLEDGIAGDRLVHVRAPSGRIVTSRTHPAAARPARLAG